MRKAVLFLLCLIVLITCSGCLSLPLFPKEVFSGETADPNAYLTEFRNNTLFSDLPDYLRRDYGAIYSTIKDNFEKDNTVHFPDDNGGDSIENGLSVVLPDPLDSKSDIHRLYTAVFYDNPAFFYFSSIYSLEGTQEQTGLRYNRINLLCTMDAATRTQAMARLEQVTDEIIRDTPVGADDFEKERYLHDCLLMRCSYGEECRADRETEMDPYTAYGALVNGHAVCEGYSRGMQWLLSAAKIPCTLVTGRSVTDEEEHMWNVVTVNGKNYHLDATWDDYDSGPRYTYFNLDNAHLQSSHQTDAGQTITATCTSMDDNYHVRRGTYITGTDQEELAQAIARRINAGENTVELRLTAENYSLCLAILKSHTRTCQLVDPLLSERTLNNYQVKADPEEYILYFTVLSYDF